MATIRVGVLRGGVGHEYDVSLKTGGNVLRNLPSEKYRPRDILLTKDGQWHLDGFPISPSRLVNNVDVVFNALHGEFGEDGQVQRILDSIRLPYTGSGHLASSLGMNKSLAKKIFKDNGIKTPYGVLIEAKEERQDEAEVIAYDAFSKISPPWIVKPVSGGSSVGLFLAKSFPQLIEAVKKCLIYSKAIIVEEYIVGQEATCGVIDNFRNKDVYPLLPIEIIKFPQKELFDYEAKYQEGARFSCPGRLGQNEKSEIERLSVLIHQILNLQHYSRSDFIINKKGIYALEVNSLPDLSEGSTLLKSLNSIGVNYPQFLDHVIDLALKR